MLEHRDSGRIGVCNVALQGGGAHGAFTWGVLDRLLASGQAGLRAIYGDLPGEAVRAYLSVLGEATALRAAFALGSTPRLPPT